jgi:hypothetical protein
MDPMGQDHNHLLDRLPSGARRHLLAAAEPYELVIGHVLAATNRLEQAVYFPVHGCVLVSMRVPGHAPVGIAAIDRDGMFDASRLDPHGTRRLFACVQAAGASWRVPATRFTALAAANVSIATLAATQADRLLLAAAGEAACLAYHPLRQRLARWLLALSAGADDDRLVATHQAMADLLGVRRSAITLAAGDLRAVGMVSYHRGHIAIGDRARLHALACGCGLA